MPCDRKGLSTEQQLCFLLFLSFWHFPQRYNITQHIPIHSDQRSPVGTLHFPTPYLAILVTSVSYCRNEQLKIKETFQLLLNARMSYHTLFSTAHTIAQTDIVYPTVFCVPSSETIKMLLKCEIFFSFRVYFPNYFLSLPHQYLLPFCVQSLVTTAPWAIFWHFWFLSQPVQEAQWHSILLSLELTVLSQPSKASCCVSEMSELLTTDSQVKMASWLF